MQIDLARSLVYMRGLYNISWQKRLSHSGSAGKGYITSAAATAAATLVSVNKQRKQEIEKRRVIKRENSSSCRVFFSSQFSCDIDCVSSCGPEGCGWKRARPACAHPTVIYIYISMCECEGGKCWSLCCANSKCFCPRSRFLIRALVDERRTEKRIIHTTLACSIIYILKCAFYSFFFICIFILLFFLFHFYCITFFLYIFLCILYRGK